MDGGSMRVSIWVQFSFLLGQRRHKVNHYIFRNKKTNDIKFCTSTSSDQDRNFLLTESKVDEFPPEKPTKDDKEQRVLTVSFSCSIIIVFIII